MHVLRWRPAHTPRETHPGSAHGISHLREAYAHLLNGEATSADQEKINRHTEVITRFIGAHLQSQGVLAKDEAAGKLDKIGDVYTEKAFRDKVAALLNPAYISSHKPHALLVARLDDYDDLCEKFGAADVEDEFLAPAAAALTKRLSTHSFAGRLGTAQLVALMPEVDLITADLLGKDAIRDIATITLPRSVDGFRNLGMSIGVDMIAAGDTLDDVLAGITAKLDEVASEGHDILSDAYHTEIGLKRTA